MTTRYFAFLRAINIGGRRVTNDELKTPFVSLGLDQVDAYQAAGNITFVADEEEPHLTDALEASLSSEFGFDVPVFLRTETEIRSSTRGNHFSPEQLAATQGKIQVSFMKAAPGENDVQVALELVPDDDRVLFVDREWFWLPKAGVSESTLPVASVERIIGPMTMRTLGTVDRMLARFGDSP